MEAGKLGTQRALGNVRRRSGPSVRLMRLACVVPTSRHDGSWSRVIGKLFRASRLLGNVRLSIHFAGLSSECSLIRGAIIRKMARLRRGRRSSEP
jgi:hypothetical protein